MVRYTRQKINRVLGSVVECLESRRMLSTYYVSPAGSDSNSGTSPSSPWQHISKVNSTTLNPGDMALFQGGQTFIGTLSITHSGSSGNPITYGSYGTGSATIESPSASSFNDRSITLANAHDITIQNLDCLAGPANGNLVHGIKLTNSGTTKLSDIIIDHVSVHGFSSNGVFFDGTNSTTPAGFNSVTVSNSSFYDNAGDGIIFATDVSSLNGHANIHSNIMIVQCVAHDNGANGFAVQGMQTAIVEESTAYGNGAESAGSIGFLFASGDDSITVKNNEAYGNIYNISDGGGFDFDWGVTNSVMEYNYSHDNDGHGFQLDNPPINGTQYPNSGNVIRYNISQNDGRTTSASYSGIDIWSQVTDASIYNNTVYMTPRSTADSNPPAAINIHPDGTAHASNISYNNNAIITAQVNGNSATVPLITTSGINSSANVTFVGDEYWTSGGPFSISFEGTNYTSFTSWQNTSGQEKVGGVGVALNADPQFLDAGQGVIGSAAAYRLQGTSPLIAAGQSLGIAGNDQDYFSTAIPTSGVPDIGAAEYVSFSNQDIGGSTPSGSTTQNATGYDMTGGGANGINGTSDQAQYAYSQRINDFDARVQVTSEAGPSDYSQGGLMARESLSGGSRQVSMTVTKTVPGDGSSNVFIYFKYRNITNGSTTQVGVGLVLPTGTEPWMRLVRWGDTFTGYYSLDGVTWTEVGSVVMSSMSDPLYVGLAESSRISTSTANGSFRELA